MGTPAFSQVTSTRPAPPPRFPPPFNLDVFSCKGLEGGGLWAAGVQGANFGSPSRGRAHSLLLAMVSHFLVCFPPSLSHFRGFGFVTFADPASVDKVLGQPHHELDSKTVGCFFPSLLLFAPVQDPSGH